MRAGLRQEAEFRGSPAPFMPFAVNGARLPGAKSLALRGRRSIALNPDLLHRALPHLELVLEQRGHLLRR